MITSVLRRLPVNSCTSPVNTSKTMLSSSSSSVSSMIGRSTHQVPGRGPSGRMGGLLVGSGVPVGGVRVPPVRSVGGVRVSLLGGSVGGVRVPPVRSVGGVRVSLLGGSVVGLGRLLGGRT